ncbi:phosphoglycerate kinase [Candidatus Nitrosocosmicus arcticus]|uniref:Phosphoglycerate kinase n=1 Tax=Candidatus Nitrosocosmicus arcticus TaxID=2035267 RepID=A0A557SXC8_9ARCH|nr:phosphoglycerate kinase [Candidatus Nitrosocosmicus arcticus]TVP41252.1 phosphoglycerate kinase [Candidatus Nitrosocosmicus arcticus]
MEQIKFITDFDDRFYLNKKIFVRVDFNVTVKDNAVSEDYRIRSAIPTIEYLVKRGAKVILASHLDRPSGKDLRHSLRPVSKKLGEMLSSFNAGINFADDCIGKDTIDMVNGLKNGDVLLLENLRFYSEEEKNDPVFSEKLANYADIYVNDAFSTSHRKHSSTYGTAQYFDTKIAGFSLAQELQYLSLLRENPSTPFTLVIGGVKIKDKIGALNHLLPKADKVLIGGAASYTFLKAKGYSVGDSLIEEDYLPWATKALGDHSDKIILPIDHKVAHDNSSQYQIVEADIPKNMKGFDIGDKTIQKFSFEIHNNGLGTIFWNGPMGYFEKEIFSNGTKSVAVSMALAYWRGVKTLIGGGDTLEAMKISGVSEKEVTHVSTGGGATLRFLAGDEMPGIDILRD